MSRLDLQAETTRLARLLQVPEDQLGYLLPLGSEALRELRERVNATLFDETRSMFQRVAAASKLLPVAAIAKIGEKVFGPLLCARVAGMLAPERALEVALRLPDLFLADVSVQLDPRSAREVIGHMPADRVAAVAAILLQRRDYVTMGRFVDYLSRETIRSVLGSIRDDAALLHLAFYVENKARLNDIAGLLSTERLRRIVAVAESSNLWAEALALISHIEGDLQRRLGDIAAEHDETVLTRMLGIAQEQDLWDALLPVVGAMSQDKRQRLARLPALAEVPVLAAVIRAADGGGLWDRFLPLVAQMSEPARRAAAQAVEQQEPEVLLRLLQAVQSSAAWDDLIGLLGLMDETEKANIARLIGLQDEPLLAPLLTSTHQQGLWPRLMPILALMPPAQLDRLNRLAGRLGLEWKL